MWNCVWSDWVIVGIALVNLPDVAEWRTEIAPSFGTVMSILPDVVFIRRDEGTMLLVSVIAPDIPLMSALLNEPEMFCAPDVTDVLRVDSAALLLTVRRPDIPLMSALSNEPEMFCAPDVAFVLSSVALVSETSIEPDVLTRWMMSAFTLLTMKPPEVEFRSIVCALTSEIYMLPEVLSTANLAKLPLSAWGRSTSSLLLGIRPILLPSM